MESKHPVKSKTVTGNIIASIILLGLPKLGIAVTPEISVLALTVGNILLRFISKSPIAFRAPNLETKVVTLYKAYKELKKEVETLKNEKANV